MNSNYLACFDTLIGMVLSGFLLPLSGGADSASVAAIVHVMSSLVSKEARTGNSQVIKDVSRLLSLSEDSGQKTPASVLQVDAATVTQAVLHTVYMGTSNSTEKTRTRAASVAREINSYHSWLNIDTIVCAVVSVFTALIGKTPKYQSEGYL